MCTGFMNLWIYKKNAYSGILLKKNVINCIIKTTLSYKLKRLY